ncbi:hypothetical protein GCM10022403_092270 [Streptomyces coacervatus]|uniref:Uncharacterized protein n=1 Tax=Streptomyces coacervatus TaxID=647381 RepID=A0ABP7JJK2_9ACTN
MHSDRGSTSHSDRGKQDRGGDQDGEDSTCTHGFPPRLGQLRHQATSLIIPKNRSANYSLAWPSALALCEMVKFTDLDSLDHGGYLRARVEEGRTVGDLAVAGWRCRCRKWPIG